MDIQNMTEQELQQRIKASQAEQQALQAEQQRRRQQRIENYASQVESVLDGLSAEDRGVVMQRLGYQPTIESQVRAPRYRTDVGYSDPIASLNKEHIIESLKGFG